MSMRNMNNRRHGNIISPYEQRRRSGFGKSDNVVDDALVVNPADIAAFDRMCAARPMKPPPYAFGTLPTATPGAVAARKDRNGIA